MAVLETSMMSKTCENLKKSGKTDKKQMKKVLLVAQELKLARVLAGNNKTARERALKSLKKWFQNRSTTIPFTEDDFLRLWKGLFYSMWMSDKPLIQEQCAENIANLVHALPFETSMLFYKCGMMILMNEWFGIDQLRLDKFLMFVRRLLRQILLVVKNHPWTRDSVKKFTETLSNTILDTQKQKPMGLLMHFTEIYLEELAKVSKGELPPHLMTEFLGPFIKQLALSDDNRVIDHIRKHVFVYLIRQSDLGLEYRQKYEAWRDLGFPGSIDSMQKVETEDLDQEEIEQDEGDKALDPRAGRVDVELPQLKFHPKAISKAISECKFDKNTNSKSRNCLTELSEHFKKMASGIYPLGIKRVKTAKDGYDTSIRKAVNRLVKFDKKIKGKKNNKKRKLQQENNDEVELRGGKKIKLSEQLHEKIANELNHVTLADKPRKKRKRAELAEDPPTNQNKSGPSRNSVLKLDRAINQKKTGGSRNDMSEWELEAPPTKRKKNGGLLELESVFRRNSGTWFVTRSVKKVEIPQSKWDINGETSREIELSRKVESPPLNKVLFPSNRWDTPGDKLTQIVEKRLKKKQFFSSANSTPTKKVKINTKLNRSQDVHEHVAQIKSSPAIPYDANKKPAKPLLKTPTIKSPINPFYKL